MPSIDRLRAALQAAPDDAFLLYGIAMELAKAGDHEEAVEHFDRAIVADATNPYHYFHKARSLEEIDREDEARRTLETGLEVAQRHGDAKAASELIAYLDTL